MEEGSDGFDYVVVGRAHSWILASSKDMGFDIIGWCEWLVIFICDFEVDISEKPEEIGKVLVVVWKVISTIMSEGLW